MENVTKLKGLGWVCQAEEAGLKMVDVRSFFFLSLSFFFSALKIGLLKRILRDDGKNYKKITYYVSTGSRY